jgi:integrase
MATIVARSSSYQARIRRKGIAVSQSFITRETAERWARKIEHQIDEGTYLPSGPTYDLTLKQALLDYSDEVESTGRKGWVQERTKARVLAKSIVVDKPLHSITAADIIKIRQDRLKVASGGTVRLDLAVISAVFHRAIEVWQLDIKSPMRDVKRPPPGKARDRRLKSGELERILAATESDFLPPAILLALATAMRRGELAPLAWTTKVVKGVLHLADTKNGTARDVPITLAADSALKSKDAVRGATLTQAFVRAVRRARKAYEAECLLANLPPEVGYLEDLRFHDLRHEATSRLFEAGLSIMEASAVTGHKSLQMLKRYTHLDAATIANKLNAAAKGKS